MDRDEFMELVYETFADEPDNVLANGIIEAADAYVEYEKAQLSQQSTTSDLISRQDAIDEIKEIYEWHDNVTKERIIEHFARLPSAQPEKRTEKRTETHACDLIDRQAAIDAIGKTSDELYENIKKGATFPQRQWFDGMAQAQSILENLPSARPARTCVNCGRTMNNGGWYADGGTRCPIEEHYALPKDGYCHLWEKRNVTDDDYPERREE